MIVQRGQRRETGDELLLHPDRVKGLEQQRRVVVADLDVVHLRRSKHEEVARVGHRITVPVEDHFLRLGGFDRDGKKGEPVAGEAKNLLRRNTFKRKLPRVVDRHLGLRDLTQPVGLDVRPVLRVVFKRTLAAHPALFLEVERDLRAVDGVVTFR